MHTLTLFTLFQADVDLFPELILRAPQNMVHKTYIYKFVKYI
jgi:hypothetical protein